MGNVSLATLLVTTAQPATPIWRPTTATPPPTIVGTPTPPTGTKQWCLLSNQGAASPKSGEGEAAVLDMTPEDRPHWRWKMGGLWQSSWKKAVGRPFQRTQKSSRQPGGPIIPPTEECLPRRGPMTWCQFSEKWPGDQVPEHRYPWGAGGLGQWVGTKSNQLCCKNLPMGGTIFLHHTTNWVTKHHGVEGDLLSQGPTLVRQLIVLPLVWQGGAEWGHCGESFMKCALPPRPHLLYAGNTLPQVQTLWDAMCPPVRP